MSQPVEYFFTQPKEFLQQFLFYMVKVMWFLVTYFLYKETAEGYTLTSPPSISPILIQKNGTILCLHFVSYLFIVIDLYASKLVGMILCRIIEKCNIEP